MKAGRRHNLKEGLSAKCDVFGGDDKKRELMNNADCVSMRCMLPLFQSLQKAQTISVSEETEDD